MPGFYMEEHPSIAVIFTKQVIYLCFLFSGTVAKLTNGIDGFPMKIIP